MARLHEQPIQHLLDVPIDALAMDEALTIVGRAIDHRERLLIGVVNAAKMVNMRRDAALRSALLDADMILPDGMAVVWASRLLGRPLPERVAGIDLMHGLLAQAARQGHRVYCLGATDDVLSAAVARMQADYPGLVVVGSQHGYFDREDESWIAEQIRQSRADILLVAMTSPKKEQFLARWFDQMDVAVCHGVGGSFDVLAGKVRRAPRMWQRLGMEWLYRVWQEPRRMWRRYLVTNTLFCGMVLSAMVAGRGRRRKRRA